MRIVTFRHGGKESLGALRGSEVVSLALAYAGHLERGGASPDPLAGTALPDDMVSFLAMGDRAMEAARIAIEFAEGNGAAGPHGERLLLPLAEVELLAPVPRPGKLLCIGLNYRDHAEEVGMRLPDRPLLFSKYANAITAPGAPVVLPPITQKVDYEAELAVVIGRRTRRVSEAGAMDCVAGYTIMNDVTARDLQFGDGQWIRGKTLDTFAPLGPALVTKDEVPDPHDLRISLRLNGEVMQDSSTSNLVFGVPRLVSFLSEAITLEPGDVIATGTPPGVGHNRQPPVYLKPGDVMVVEIERVGSLENPVVAE